MKPEKWDHVRVTCWNYLKGVRGGLSSNVEISEDRFCNSDCENTWCPLHNDKETEVKTE